MKNISMTILFFAFCFSSAYSQIIVTLNGTPHFDTSSLMVTEAGNDFSDIINELQASTTINIRNNSINNPNNYDYKLDVSLLEMVGTIDLGIERTGIGTNRSGGIATGKIEGGTPAVQVSVSPVQFVAGRGDRLNVPVKFSLRNLSVVQPAGNVTFTLVFTATML